MKFLNSCITVGFRNDKMLKNSEVLSARDFPVEDIYCDGNRTYAVLDTADGLVFERYINTLSDYIIEKYEDKILKRIISKKYPEIPNIVTNEIIKLKKEVDFSERKMVLAESLKGYFSENISGSVEGIVNFRLCNYKKHLNALVDDIVDIYYLNREYEDFIELLRYFISVQNERTDKIYIVINKDGTYTILDAKKQDITADSVSEIVNANEAKELEHEDLLLSVLISLAPEKIIVNNKENIKNRQIFETIEKVFEKVEYN